MLHKIRTYFLQAVKINLRWKIAIIVIGLIGLMDTSYLTYSHYKSQIINCPTHKQVNSCELVAESIYSTVLGVPVALIGLLFYIVITLIGFGSLKNEFNFLLNLLLPLSTLAVLFGLRLTYLQVYVIGYLCYYCILSAVMSCALLGISWKLYNEVSVGE